MTKADADNDFVVIVNTARRMALRYGTMGTFEPDDVAHNAMIKVLNRSGDRPADIRLALQGGA